jgi:hypothetical protein
VTPRDLLLDRAPKGFKPGLDTGLPLSTAASALATDPDHTRTELGAFGYIEGAERVWTKGDEYVSVLAFEMTSTVGPGSLVAFIRDELGQRPSVTLFDYADAPGALGFNLFGLSRAGGRQVFCQGVVFPLSRYLFQVEDCAGGPRYSAAPLTLARGQYERAARILGQPVRSPSPAS